MSTTYLLEQLEVIVDWTSRACQQAGCGGVPAPLRSRLVGGTEAHAIQAGREARVIVDAKKPGDADAFAIAQNYSGGRQEGGSGDDVPGRD